MNLGSRIFIAGHKGLVGSSILQYLKRKKFKKIFIIEKKKLDLRNQSKVLNYFKKNKFDYVINCSGKVGGIYANNKYKADFIYDNISMQNNIIYSSYLTKVKSLIFLGSSCIYPKNSKIPMKETDLLSGKLEETNEPYAIAKIAGIKMCESFNYQYNTNFKCLMPCNLYGPNDNYDLTTSHFLPALIKKIYGAKIKNKKKVIIWGSGKPLREIMYVEDLADACLFFLKKKTKHSLINIGSGEERSIYEYAKIIAKKINYTGTFEFDKSKPDGMKRKLVDSSLATSYGWKSKILLELGLSKTIKHFIEKEYKN
ncbi:GDP-L-fucose synthase [Candidatus Pelagibacter sp.]|jgi:GDP-L-fucose synthase|nr:GDP-L-fucose synthase [Candidatus Pelagibacter sp.]